VRSALPSRHATHAEATRAVNRRAPDVVQDLSRAAL